MKIEKIEEREYNPVTKKWDGNIDSLFLTFYKNKKKRGCIQIDITKKGFSTNNFILKGYGFNKFLKYIKNYIINFNQKYNTNYNRITFTESDYYEGVDFSLLKKDGENYLYEI